MGVQPCILLYIFCIQYVAAHNIISDKTDEHCINKKLCEVAGIVGHVDCISDTCVCINNAKILEFKNTRGCYRRNKLGEECEFDQDCWEVKDSECIQPLCKRTCECLPNRENVDGTCEVIKNKAIGTYCESHDECSATLMCLSNKCNCESDQFYANDKCFKLKDYNMCRNDHECNASYFCEKKQKDLIYGFCQLSGQRLYSHPCRTMEDCRINGYVDCQSGICTCVDNSTFNNNGCYKQSGVGEKCQFQEDCKDMTKCKLDDHTNIGRCMCPENHVYYENACIKIECLKNRDICMTTKDCKKNEKCESDVTCNKKFCQCDQHTVKINNICMDLKHQAWCEKNTDCVVKHTICQDNVCKCSNDTILLNDTCIELKGQKYGEFCHKECAPSGTTCIRSDHSSTIGVCGCRDNYVLSTSVCKQREIPGAAVYGNLEISEYTNAATIISVEIYCFLFIHFII